MTDGLREEHGYRDASLNSRGARASLGLLKLQSAFLGVSSRHSMQQNAGRTTKKTRLLMYRVFIKYCVFSKILEYSGLLPFSVFPRCQCVYTHQAGRTPALHSSKTGRLQNCSEQSQKFTEKIQ